MRKSSRFWVSGTFLGGVLAMLVGCYEGDTTDPIFCTEQFVYGLTVTVRDQTNGTPIAEDAVLTLREGAYEEVVTDSWDGSSLSGAGERPGTYTVTVEHPDYETWTRVGVVITADECHVIPVSLTAELTPTP